MRTRGKAGTLVDTSLIATSFSLDESKVQILLDAPTADLVREFLVGLTTKAEEFDNVKAEKLRANVELENTIRSHEAKAKAVKSSLTKSQREAEELRKNVAALENSRVELESQLDELKANSSNSTSEVGVLQARITSLEASNRETLSVLEAKSAAHDSLADDFATQHQKIISLRREISGLEDKNQSLENAASGMRFREQGLTQEIALLKKNIEWHEQELKTRGEESSKFRKEKNARIAELQRANDDATSTIESLKRTENALRERVDEVSQKAEDAFNKVQKMQESAIESESAFRTELESARRLAELQKQSAETARSRLQELETSLEQVKDAAADEIGQLQAEIETERTEKEAVETKLAELELEVEHLQAAQSTFRQQTPTPGTPVRNTNGLLVATPLRNASPLPMTPATARSKGNLSFTQLVSEVSGLRAELEAERRRSATLTQELDEMLQDLESRGPEQEDFRQDKERMEAEVIAMSSLLDAANAEKEVAVDDARKWEGENAGLVKETNVLRQQLRDLSAQIKVLLVEMQARDQGLEMLDAAGSAQLQILAAGEVDEESALDQTSAGALITQRLLLFRNISELQEQNIQLLKLNRGLADQMEGDEAKARDAKQADAMRELEDLQDKAQRYEDQVRSLSMQTESITRERDMFRRMLAHRGPLPANSEVAESMFGQSIHGDGVPATPRGGQHRMDDTSETVQLSEYAKLVKELQSHLDTIRREASTDHGILRQQVDSLAKEKSELQSEVARNGGQISLAHDRYEMLQANYRMLQGENGELQKRTQILNENAAKQDLRTQQVAEELVDARALAESMRAETSNLKAERELWKNIEGRLSEDNRQLLDERSRLNKMLADVQNLQNEKEQSDSEARRRLQSRTESLESELSSVRRKLEAEAEESKKAHLRREYEQEQSKTRIDDLIKSLSEVREELIAAKTTRDQLQARVDEMKIDLRNAEERAQALQPRPSSGGPLSGNSNGGATMAADGDLTREQELGVEVADLKRDLELTRAELENAKTQVEQYKAISQATEEELQSLNDTNDQYREDTDRRLLEKDGVIQQLEQRIEDINNELTMSNTELSDLRTRHEQSGMELEAQKTSLEGELARLQDECERQTEKAKLYQQDLKAQAEIAQQAQQSYEDELVKHADAAKSLQNVRVEYNALRTEVAGIRADAEASKASLSQGQEKWSELRDQYEKELNEIRSSRNDLKSQNKLLHDQLEAVGNQISALQQQRAVPDDENEDHPTTAENAGSKLQEVVSYLRREKEIVDVQYELALQESKRTKQQLDYVQSQLDETRFKLGEERRQRSDQEANATSHSKLLETINELNLYRESSATLRQESRQAQAKLQEKIQEIEALAQQILPLQSKIREVENELEMKDGELKLLQEDRDRWRERTQNIISKYDRVDPAEIEGMKTKITDLETERDELLAKRHELQQQIEGFPDQLQQASEEAKKGWQESRAKLIEQAKERSRQQQAKISGLEQELAGMRLARDTLQQDLSTAQQSLDQATAARDEAIAQRDSVQVAADAATAAVAALTAGVAPVASEAIADDAEEGQIEEGEVAAPAPTMSSEMESALQVAETKATEQAARADALQAEVVSLQETIQAQTTHMEELAAKVEELEQSLATARAESSGPLTAPENTAGDITSVEQELAAAQAEIASLKASLEQSASVTAVPEVAQNNPEAEGPGDQVIADRVALQVAQLKQELERQHEVTKQDLEAAFQTRSNNMKRQLNEKLREGKEKAKEDAREEVRQELIQQHSQEIQALKQQHEQDLATAKEEHRLIVERVTREGVEAVEKARANGTNPATSVDMKPNGDVPVASKAEVNDETTGADIPSLSDQQIRELLAKNEVVRGIVKKNIIAKIGEEKEKLVKEHEKDLAEKISEELKRAADEHTKQKAEAVSKAVNMEAMKQKVKLNMADTKEKAAKVKLEIVETAARETPQRAVVEVWEIAKAAKATPAAPGAAAPAVASIANPPAAPPSTPAIQPPSGPAAAAAVQSPPAAPAAAAAAPPSIFAAAAAAQAAAVPDEQSRLAARQARFGAPSAPPTGPTAEAKGAADSTTPPPAGAPASIRGAATATAAGLPRPTGLPTRGGGGIPQPAGGRGRGIPVAQGSQIGRGASGLPRGGAPPQRGRGRGGPASPLNAGAVQFVPNPHAAGAGGAKRPLEGGEQGDGKRIRGAGGPQGGAQ